MTLSEEQKEWLVTQWAMFRTPAEIRRGFKDLFGVEITPKQAHQYNPSGSRGKEKSMRKWKLVFTHVRHKFLTEVAEIPIANAAVRLNRLEQLCVNAMEKGKAPLAADIIEQAAKEVGGLFTNKREVEAHHEATHNHNHSHDFGAEEARGMLADMLAKALQAAQAPQGITSTKH